jgi:hypothetical protein
MRVDVDITGPVQAVLRPLGDVDRHAPTDAAGASVPVVIPEEMIKEDAVA